MVETRYVKIESEKPVGQFLETSLERFLADEENDVGVTELDPNAHAGLE